MKEITKISRGTRAQHIFWTDTGNEFESIIYKHSDGSWHLDPGTVSLGREHLAELYDACVRYRTGRHKRAKRKNQKKTQVLTWFSEN